MCVGYRENLQMRNYLFDWIVRDIEKACEPDDGWGPVFANPQTDETRMVKILLQREGARGAVLWSPRQGAEWEIPGLVKELVSHARILAMFPPEAPNA